MRKIKFRGKSLESHEWVYGSLITNEAHTDNGKFMVAFIVPSLPCALEGKDLYTARMWRVDPSTVGQFTGLLDKEGNEIYDGDIVSFYNFKSRCTDPGCDSFAFNLAYESYVKKVEDVVYCEDGMVSCDGSPLAYCGIFDLDTVRNYLGVSEEDGWSDSDGNIIDERVLGIEIIGNVHDNPELLKQ
jgi:uncharacterized phage protein (TIGR01671 family)